MYWQNNIPPNNKLESLFGLQWDNDLDLISEIELSESQKRENEKNLRISNIAIQEKSRNH